MSVHFSKKSDNWTTPFELFKLLNDEFEFTLDAAASEANALCPIFYSKEDDSLNQTWRGETVFCNPPYSKVSEFIAKAHRESICGEATVVLLLPARTETKAWWEHVWRSAGEIRFLVGRLKFGGGKHSAPFPSVVVIMGHPQRFPDGPICRAWDWRSEVANRQEQNLEVSL